MVIELDMNSSTKMQHQGFVGSNSNCASFDLFDDQQDVQMAGFGLLALVGADHRIAEQRAAREGCSVRGSLLVNKVEGNFHIAVGRSHKANGTMRIFNSNYK